MRALSLLVIGSIWQQPTARAFRAGLAACHSVNLQPEPRTRTRLSSSSPADDGSMAESILEEFHRSNLSFRIVVIGNGAILETTSKLGPTSKSSISPKSGERLLTFANEDASFEFHVKVDQVCKIIVSYTQSNDGEFCSFCSIERRPSAIR